VGEGPDRASNIEPCSADPAPSHALNPPVPSLSRAEQSAILGAYIEGDDDLGAIASDHGLSVPELIAFLESPPVDAMLTRLERVLARRTRLIAAQHAPAATRALNTLTEALVDDELNSPIAPDPRARATRQRARETLRKTAVAIARATTAPRSTPGSPASRQPGPLPPTKGARPNDAHDARTRHRPAPHESGRPQSVDRPTPTSGDPLVTSPCTARDPPA
jgi:hypothetical protein